MDYEGTFKSFDGLDFYERRWEPDCPARTHVVLIHGYGEHCSRYAHVAQAFNQAGIVVHSYDQRGFGRSPGKRAYVRDFEVLLRDLDTYLDHVRPRLQGVPWFFMGHSMGGLVLASYAETRKVEARGLIFSSLFLALPDDVPRILVSLANVLGRLAPWLPLGGVDNSRLSRDPQVVEAANRDPLSYHGMVAARTGAEFNVAIARARANCGAITAPVFVLHGSDDRIVPNAGSRLLYERYGSKDKTFKLYEGSYHEVWNDLDKETLFADIIHWITARLP
jgi:acylglycerol lipase